MLEPGIVELLAGIGFFVFLLDFMYVLVIKRRNKNNGQNSGVPLVIKQRQLARAGIIALDVMICICCVMVFLFDPFFISWIPRLISGPGSPVFQVVGFTLVVSGDVVLFFAYKALGIYWAYPLDGTTGKHKLVKDGPYKFIRHPVYDAFGIIAIGFVLLYIDWVLLIMCIAGIAGLYVQAIEEEKALIVYFGDEYARYARETGRFFSRRSR